MKSVFSKMIDMKAGLYYIRNEGYLGNALMWWHKSRNGYTCDIRNALKVGYEEAENICKRPEDTAYPVDYIDNNIQSQKLIIDSQYVGSAEQLFK